MSLEKKREKKEKEPEKNLENSTFRRDTFTPLGKIQQTQTLESEDLEDFKEKLIEEELTVIETEILEIAKEILKLKRYDAEFEVDSELEIQKYPIIEKLYATCVAKLSYKKGYTKHEIFLTIRSLDEKNWIITNDRRTKLEILENEKLMTIYDFIRKNPGIHARDDSIQEELSITRTPFLKHVMTLERFKLIRSTKMGKTLHFFANDIPEDLDDYKVIFLNPLIPKIIEQIFKDDSVAISKIGENLDIYSGTIQYHVKKLKELNLLKSTKSNSGKKIHLINIELLKKYNELFKEPDFSNLLSGF